MIYGDGAGEQPEDGCAAIRSRLVSGLIVLVDRGACFFSDQDCQHCGEPADRRASLASSLQAIRSRVALVVAIPTIPGYMISQSFSNLLKAGLPDTAMRLDPAVGIPQVGSMVGSSSRGPSNDYQQIKPEIGAPGASVSAIAGSGDGTGPFGGTSGAAPMVSGSAALLMSGFARISRAAEAATLMVWRLRRPKPRRC